MGKEGIMIRLVVLIGAIWFSVPLFAARTDKDAEVAARLDVVAIGWDGHSCRAAGIIVGEDSETVFIATTAHGHTPGADVTVLFSGVHGDPYKGNLLKEPFQKPGEGDLAVVRVKKDGRLNNFMGVFQWDMRTGRRLPEAGTPVHSLGCSRSKAWSTGGDKEVVFDVRDDLLQITSAAIEGQSGGAVFDESWELVAMVHDRVGDRFGTRSVDSILATLRSVKPAVPVALKVRAEGDRARGPYEIARDEARRALVRLLVDRAASLKTSNRETAALLAAEALDRAPSADADQMLRELSNLRVLRYDDHRLTGSNSYVSLDQRVFIAGGGDDHVARVWNIPEQRLVARLDDTLLPPKDFAADLEGKIVAGGSWRGGARIWKIDDSKPLSSVTTSDVAGVAVSDDGQFVALESPAAIEVRKQTGELVATIPTKPGRLVIANSGQWIAKSTGDGVEVLGVATRGVVGSWRFPACKKLPKGSGADPDDDDISADCSVAPVGIDDTGVHVRVIVTHSIYSKKAAEEARGHGSYRGDDIAATWMTVDIKSGRMTETKRTKPIYNDYPLHPTPGGVLRTAIQGDNFITGGRSQFLTAARLGRPESARPLPLSEGVVAAAISSDGSLAAGVGDDAVLRVWQIAGSRIASTKSGMAGVRDVAFSPDEKALLLGMASGELWRRDLANLETGQVVARGTPIRHVTVSLNGKRILILHEKDVEVLDAADYRRLRSQPGANLDAAALSPDGEIVALTTGKTLRAVNVATGREAWTLPLGMRGYALTFSADGAYLGVAGDGAIVWDLATKQPVMRAPTGEIITSTPVASAIAFGPDGRSVLVRGESFGVRESVYRPADVVKAACGLIGVRLSKASWDQYVGEGDFRPVCGLGN